jgi:hypothetical protein
VAAYYEASTHRGASEGLLYVRLPFLRCLAAAVVVAVAAVGGAVVGGVAVAEGIGEREGHHSETHPYEACCCPRGLIQ